MRLLYAAVGFCFMALASVVVAGDLAYLEVNAPDTPDAKSSNAPPTGETRRMEVNAPGAPDSKGEAVASRLMIVCIEAEQKDQLAVFDFASGTHTNIPISSIKRREAWTEQAVITRYGLTSYAAYRIERALRPGVSGKIGKLTPDGIYTSRWQQ